MTDRTKKSVWIVSGLLLLGVLVLALYDFSLFRSANPRPAWQAQDRSLGLRAERGADELKLAWNPEATALKTAAEAELLIVDGSHRTQLLLTQDQIHRGNVLYSPFTDSVAFNLKAFDRNRNSTAENLQVIQSGQEAAPIDGVRAIDERSQVDSPVRAIDTSTLEAPHRSGRVVHGLSKVGRAPAKLWPFHHRAQERSH